LFARHGGQTQPAERRRHPDQGGGQSVPRIYSVIPEIIDNSPILNYSRRHYGNYDCNNFRLYFAAVTGQKNLLLENFALRQNLPIMKQEAKRAEIINKREISKIHKPALPAKYAPPQDH
jgi:hypothetical protein